MKEITYGYVRVSTHMQNEARQLAAMREFGVAEENIVTERLSGKDFNRPLYQDLVKKLQTEDVLVVKSIDRLGRNYDEILEQWAYITKERKAAIVVLDMPLLDTRQGRDLTGTLIADIVLQLLSYVAQTERDYIRQRQAEGIAAARERGQAVLERFPGVAVEAYHIDNVIHVVRPNAISRQHEHMTHVSLTEAPSLPEVPLPLGKLLFEADHETLEGVLAFLTEQGWAEDYELIFSVSHLLEMTIQGASKGGMVRRLAARLGISMEHVYCAGDEANDLSMLHAAAEGFAPANASAAVRESGAAIVCHAREGAVADVIEVLDRKYS